MVDFPTNALGVRVLTDAAVWMLLLPNQGVTLMITCTYQVTVTSLGATWASVSQV